MLTAKRESVRGKPRKIPLVLYLVVFFSFFHPSATWHTLTDLRVSCCHCEPSVVEVTVILNPKPWHHLLVTVNLRRLGREAETRVSARFCSFAPKNGVERWTTSGAMDDRDKRPNSLAASSNCSPGHCTPALLA